MRLSNQDLSDVASPVLSQLSSKGEHEIEQHSANGPRIAAYSVWVGFATVAQH